MTHASNPSSQVHTNLSKIGWEHWAFGPHGFVEHSSISSVSNWRLSSKICTNTSQGYLCASKGLGISALFDQWPGWTSANSSVRRTLCARNIDASSTTKTIDEATLYGSTSVSSTLIDIYSVRNWRKMGAYLGRHCSRYRQHNRYCKCKSKNGSYRFQRKLN